ncbi:MAG: amidohydrolase family protein [Candidatus Thorarchaeota archaeon]
MKPLTTNADLILTGGIVVTANTEWEVFNPGAVVVQGHSLIAIGPANEIATRYTATENVDCSARILIPGLVNAHTHVPMTLLRGMADDVRLDVWLMGYMMPVEREFVNPEFCRLGAQLACVELLRSGITCFADMYYFEKYVAEATAEAGLRALCGQTILRFPAPDASSYEDGLARASHFIETWRNHPLILPAVAPHAPYTSTANMLLSCAELAAEYDVPIHIHLAETALEIELIQQEYGTGVVDWIEQQELFKAKVLAAHCVHLTETEIRQLYRHKAGVVHCPTSNLKLASGIAPTAKMLAAGLNVGIGTDGPASNNDLDMFEETRLAALLPKAVSGDPTTLPARQAFGMATIFGARAIHLGHLAGSLEPGKRADLVLVDLALAHNTPAFKHDPNAIYAQLIYAAKANDVTDVMVNGQWLMRERNLLTLVEADIIQQAREYARRIDAFVIEREQSVLRKLVAIGGLDYQESFEVQVKARITRSQQIKAALQSEQLEIIRHDHCHEYDTYFLFARPEMNRLRIREADFIDEDGELTSTGVQLTLIGPAEEYKIGGGVLLFRSRFAAPSPYTSRFYREYFKPVEEREIEKDRWRWRVIFREVEFQINLDRLIKPDLGYFVEVKQDTWNKHEAEHAASLIGELLEILDISSDSTIREEYVELKPVSRS